MSHHALFYENFLLLGLLAAASGALAVRREPSSLASKTDRRLFLITRGFWIAVFLSAAGVFITTLGLSTMLAPIFFRLRAVNAATWLFLPFLTPLAIAMEFSGILAGVLPLNRRAQALYCAVLVGFAGVLRLFLEIQAQ